MADTVVVSTRIPAEKFVRLNAEAITEGKSVGAYLRDLALRALEPPRRSEEP